MSRTERLGGEQQARGPVARPLLWIYNVVYLFGLACYLPLFLWRMVWDRSYREGIGERCGSVVPSKSDNVIWVHGVSVGEVKAAAPLVEALRASLPSVEVVVSSTTPTGRRVASRLFPTCRVVYYPLDFWRFPARALDRVRPRCVLLVELELWPNFLHAAEQRQVPVAVVNGRISEKSWRGYRRVSWLLPQLDRIDLFAVQNDTYAKRLADLGVSVDKIHVAGNIKYDCLTINEEPVAPDAEFARLLGGAPAAVIVGGSTHAGEERMLARVAICLERRLDREVRLIVAPRHPDRSGSAIDDVRRELREHGRDGAHGVVRLTAERQRGAPSGRADWLVVDTIGDLEKAYSMADVVFVGGSFAKHGGQNMLEPVSLGKPTVFGPHVWNFRADVDLLLAGKGVLQVEDEDGLEQTLTFLLSHPVEARALVKRAQEVLRAMKGATERTVRLVMELLQ